MKSLAPVLKNGLQQWLKIIVWWSSVWWGVGTGVCISLVLGAVFAIMYYTAQQNLFQGGTGQFIFKGVVAWVASIFIMFLAFAMLRYKGWEDKWARKLGAVTKVSD